MLPDRVSNPGPLTYESDALPIALRGPAGYEVDRKNPSRESLFGITRLAKGCRTVIPSDGFFYPPHSRDRYLFLHTYLFTAFDSKSKNFLKCIYSVLEVSV